MSMKQTTYWLLIAGLFAAIVIFVYLRPPPQPPELLDIPVQDYSKPELVEFRLLDQSLTEFDTMEVDVSVPLNDGEACLVATEAAKLTRNADFECDDIQRLIEAHISVVDDTTSPRGFATARIFEINEDELTVSVMNSL